MVSVELGSAVYGRLGVRSAGRSSSDPASTITSVVSFLCSVAAGESPLLLLLVLDLRRSSRFSLTLMDGLFFLGLVLVGIEEDEVRSFLAFFLLIFSTCFSSCL